MLEAGVHNCRYIDVKKKKQSLSSGKDVIELCTNVVDEYHAMRNAESTSGVTRNSVGIWNFRTWNQQVVSSHKISDVNFQLTPDRTI